MIFLVSKTRVLCSLVKQEKQIKAYLFIVPLKHAYGVAVPACLILSIFILGGGG